MFFLLSFKHSLSTKANSGVLSMAAHIPTISASAEKVAIEFLKKGSVIAVPTDTVYGLACDATNVSAINNLYSIKCRNENKPLAICLSEVNDIEKWANIEHLPQNILKALLPGPVTIILQSINNSLDKSLVSKGKVGIRIPHYNFIRDLACGLGKPLTLTSANLSNEPSAVDVTEFSSIWDKLSAIFDGGKLKSCNSASTVVDLSETGIFHVVRKGVACKETVNILEKFGLIDKNCGI